MSDTNTNETLSSDAGGKISVKKKGVPTVVKVAAGVAITVFVGVWVFTPNAAPQTGPVSNVGASVSQIDSTPGGDTQRNNELYNQEIRRQNDERADAAVDAGESYIPFPETPLEPIEAAEENVQVEVEAAPEVPQRVVSTTVQKTNSPAPTVRRAEPVQTQQQGQPAQQEGENPFIKLMNEQFKLIAAADQPKQMSSGTVSQDADSQEGRAQGQNMQTGAPEPGMTADGRQQPVIDLSGQRVERANTGNRTASNGGADAMVSQGSITRTAGGSQQSNQPSVAALEAGQVSPEQQQGDVLIKAGDILYARVIGGVTSDHAAPVIAEVLSGGDNNKARLVGNYAVDPATGKMVVSFRQMSWEDGTSRTINALAVDENTGDAAVRSGLERRYFARYAPVFASTFIAGLAKAAGEPDNTIIDGANGQYAVQAARTTEEAAWSGLGDAMAVISSDIASNAPRGPKIILASGSTIGVMFAQDLREDQQ